MIDPIQKLNPKQKKRFEKLKKELDQARNDIEEASEDFNERLASLYDEELSTPVSVFEQALADTAEFIEEVYDGLDEYYGDRSEKWQDEEKGEALRDLMEQWGMTLDDFEYDVPEFAPHIPGIDEFLNLPIKPGEAGG